MITPYYQKNGIVLYNGNCLDVMADLPDNSCGMTFTSPPYNMRTRVRNGKYTTRENTKHLSKKYEYFDDALSIDDYFETHSRAIREMLRISGLVFWNIQIVTGNKEGIFKIIGDFAKDIKDIIIWDKGYGQPAMHGKVINKSAELILIFEKNALAGRAFRNSFFKRGEMDDIWRIKRGKPILGHRATFPVELAQKAIIGWSEKDAVIFDPFCGTGTSLLSARNEGRKAVGIEISEEYCELAAKRLEGDVDKLI